LYIPFYETHGTVAHDLSGQGNDGTLVNGPTWTVGRYGSALSFDGANDRVDIPDSSSLRVDYVTIAAWVKLDSAVIYQDIVGKHDDTEGNYGWGLACNVDGDKLRGKFSTDGSDWNTFDGATKMTIGKWYFACFTYDGNTAKLWLDGVEDGSLSVAGTLYHTTAPVRIAFIAGGTYFNGTIDEVMIFSRALTAEEIKRLYEETKTAYLNPENYWLPYEVREEFFTVSARASDVVGVRLSLFELAEVVASELTTFGTTVSATASVRLSVPLALRQVLSLPLVASTGVSAPVVPRQALGLPAVAGAELSPTYVTGVTTSLLASVRASAVASPPRQVLSLPVTAPARASDLVVPRQALSLSGLVGVRSDAPVVPRQVLGLPVTAPVRASGLAALRQALAVPKTAVVAASDLVETKGSLNVSATAPVGASAPLAVESLLRIFLAASARASAPFKGVRRRRDRFFSDVCFWYYDLDTGEFLGIENPYG